MPLSVVSKAGALRAPHHISPVLERGGQSAGAAGAGGGEPMRPTAPQPQPTLPC